MVNENIDISVQNKITTQFQVQSDMLSVITV